MNKRINKSIEDYLLEYIKIHAKDLSKPLPSENFLATKFKVSRQTARLGLNKLLNKGFLISVKGSGYFINPNIDYIKIASIGKTTLQFCTEMYDIDIDLMDLVINSNIIKSNIKKDDYYAYRKIYVNSDNENVLYTNSFILKTEFIKIDKEKIKESLLDFISESNIELESQFNKVTINEVNTIDKELFKNNIYVTPTVYGVVIDKNKRIIEVFERRYNIDHFNVTFAKTF